MPAPRLLRDCSHDRCPASSVQEFGGMLAHVRTRVQSPGQNGSRERGFGTLKYERLYIDEIDDALMPAREPRTTTSSTPRSGTKRCPGTGRRRWPGPGRPHRPDLSNDQDPAGLLTRDRF